ncbi:hypothetical protein KM043_005916 [Ampulex compressa]|nr:hypothetical protein KM043_005916 [Ampulex compressa]
MAEETKAPRAPAIGCLEDGESSLRLIRCFLKPISAWPLSTTATMGEKVVSEIVILLSNFLIFFTLVPCFLNTIFEKTLSSVFSYYAFKVISPELTIVGNDSAPSPPYAFYNQIWDTRYSPAYEIVSFIQCFSAFVGNSVIAGTCGLAAVFVMHARGQLRIMTSWLEDLVNEDKKQRDTVQQRLGAIIRHHLRVLSFASHIEGIMHVIAFVEIMGCTFLMCISGYCIITEWNLNERENIISYCENRPWPHLDNNKVESRGKNHSRKDSTTLSSYLHECS